MFFFCGMRKVVSNVPSVFVSLSQAPSAKVSGNRTGASAQQLRRLKIVGHNFVDGEIPG